MTGTMGWRIFWLVLGALAIVAPWIITSGFWINFLILTLFLAFLGQGWNIMGGYGGQFSFGHAVFFGTGAYIQAILQSKFGWNPWLTLWFAMAGGVLVAAFIGYLSFRYGLRGSYFALITLAFAEAFRVLATAAEGVTEGGKGILIALNQDPERSFAMMQFATGTGYYYFILILTVLSLVVVWAMERSRFGAQLVAVRENEDAAEAIGVNAFRVKMGAICLSGAMTALGGVFYVQKFLLMDPNIAYGPTKSVEALVVPIIGGMGTVFGPLLGSAFLHTMGEITKEATQFFWQDRPGLDLIFYGVILVLVLAFLPNGLVGLIKGQWRGRRQGRAAERKKAVA
ncbi:MAG: branched-chain amino acid ABC transporter permease [Alphaproteobacteria bacterium]|nr:branched-chain amino acid ABC transporter permease [Alphaproteobacteria bacterium]